MSKKKAHPIKSDELLILFEYFISCKSDLSVRQLADGIGTFLRY